ncbi:acetyl-CoA synthetase-like protein [Martensiomyces pterosporus]|nr:acetyl-CoA synthetase-like protein [Martensiomyces pterosporus]
MKSYLVPFSAQPGYSAVMRHPDYKDGKLPSTFGNIATIHELFQHVVTQSPESPFLGTRQFDTRTRAFGQYTWKTAQETAVWVDNFGSGLDHVYARYATPEPGEPTQLPLGIYSINRPEWLVAEFGGFRSRRYSVALYDTLGAESVEYIVNHAEIQVIVCSIDKIPKLLKLRSRIPGLKVIICMDSFDDHGRNPAALPFTVSSIRILQEWAESKGVVLLDMNQVTEMGRAHQTAPTFPESSDICTICYTSGTTGSPKGAVSTHAGYVYAAKSSHLSVPLQNTRYLSFLPLAHCFERNVIYSKMLGGISIGFYAGDIQRILEDAQVLRPTLMVGVPRLFTRIYDRIAAATIHAPGLTGTIARAAISQKLQNLSDGGGVKHALWDRIICNKIAGLFGGRLELMISGSAPIDVNVLSFLRVATCCMILEGYGQTENNACATIGLANDYTAGHVGVPHPGVEVRLRDAPEMGYLTTDKPCPRGEILTRGSNSILGYYKDDEKTKETFENGWLLTGDIGQFNEDGTVKIIDRRKNIFKLSQGEYVAPERLEIVYSRHSLVQNIFVHGDSLKSELVAVVVPDPETFLPWARKIAGSDGATFEELCKDRNIIGALLADLEQHGRTSRLQGFEIIKNAYCDTVPFDIEGNGLLTSTFKLKRSIATAYYHEQLDELYRQMEAQA